MLLAPLWMFKKWLYPPAPVLTYYNTKRLITENNISLPAMFIDLDAFERNAKTLIEIARNGKKTLRIATKSLRCPAFITRICELGRDVCKGLMCYSAQEANFLAGRYDLDDFFIPYPTFQSADIDIALELTSKGKIITLTVDSDAAVDRLEKVCESYHLSKIGVKSDVEKLKLRVAVDLDMSFKVFGYRLGAHRSSLDSVDKFAEVAKAIQSSEHLNLVGVMGYEAHVAGLTDDNPHSPIPNFLVRFLKNNFFYPKVRCFRKAIAEYCTENNIKLEFFNGGGSGNFKDVCQDDSVTEVTAGSGFLQAQLFDYYVYNQCEAAMYFALQVTRLNKDYITCQSGGFIASGSCNIDKFPKPYANPFKLSHYDDEGYGEVQTPLKIQGRNARIKGTVKLGDPLLFRPAKSGEIGEHFQQYHLIRGEHYVEAKRTYRGHGEVFY